MAFWQKLFGSGAAPATFVHPFKDDGRVAPALAAAAKRDGAPAAALFKALDGEWEWRTQLVRDTAETFAQAIPATSRESVLNRLVDKGDVFWRLVRGHWHIVAGWEARGTGRGSGVSESAANLLHQHCSYAIVDLRDSLALAPADPTPCSLAGPALRALGDRALADQVWAEAQRRDPTGWTPAVERLRFLTERWCGSHDESSAFAREMAARSAGRDLAALTLVSFEDRFSHRVLFDKDEPGAVAWLRSSLAEVHAACSSSVDAAGYRPTLRTPTLRHLAAYLCYRVSDDAFARAQLEKVGNVYDPDPWNDTELERFLAIRRKLGVR